MLAGQMLFLVLGVSGGDMPGYYECRDLNPLQIREHAVKCTKGSQHRECIVTYGLDVYGKCAVMCIGSETVYSYEPLKTGSVKFESRGGMPWWCTIDYIPSI